MTLPSFRTLGTATNTTNNLQLPSGAVSTGSDLWSPLQSLLVGLNVLPTDADLDKADGLSGLLQGPPQSVAILEAGATAAAKAWAALASVVAAAPLSGRRPPISGTGRSRGSRLHWSVGPRSSWPPASSGSR